MRVVKEVDLEMLTRSSACVHVWVTCECHPINKDMKSKYDKWSGAVGEKTIYKATIEPYH